MAVIRSVVAKREATPCPTEGHLLFYRVRTPDNPGKTGYNVYYCGVDVIRLPTIGFDKIQFTERCFDIRHDFVRLCQCAVHKIAMDMNLKVPFDLLILIRKRNAVPSRKMIVLNDVTRREFFRDGF